MTINQSVLDMTPERINRFWNTIQQSGPDDCWPSLLKPANGKAEYRRFRLGQKLYAAHRIAYILSHGPIPDGLDILHSCDNPPCCNPAHLRPGTHAENMADMVRKGRRTVRRGEANHNAKMSDDAVALCRRWFIPRDPEFGGYALGRRFGVSSRCISNFIHGVSRT